MHSTIESVSLMFDAAYGSVNLCSKMICIHLDFGIAHVYVLRSHVAGLDLVERVEIVFWLFNAIVTWDCDCRCDISKYGLLLVGVDEIYWKHQDENNKVFTVYIFTIHYLLMKTVLRKYYKGFRSRKVDLLTLRWGEYFAFEEAVRRAVLLSIEQPKICSTWQYRWFVQIELKREQEWILLKIDNLVKDKWMIVLFVKGSCKHTSKYRVFPLNKKVLFETDKSE